MPSATISIVDNLLLAIDKPEDWTSFDVVAYLRKALGVKKIGHAGTLDPFATGLLIVAVGRSATKTIDEWSGCDKTYHAVIRFGLATDTYDRTGTTIGEGPIPEQTIVETAVRSFIGEQMQVPPQFSALKVGGRKACDVARKGQTIELAARAVTFHELSILSWSEPDLTLRVRCSKGTYIRSLAYDLGKAVGSAACLWQLRRESIGEVSVNQAIAPQEIRNRLASEAEQNFVIRRWSDQSSLSE